jgi:transcriptional regulator with XRE-family HTH domain
MEEVDEMKERGLRVKEVREALGLTQKDFAKKVYVTHSQISAIELGKSVINEQNFELICTTDRLQEGYTVNRDWLRNGGPSGLMFTTSAVIVDGMTITKDAAELLDLYDKLEAPETRKGVRDYTREKLELQNLRKKAGEKRDTSEKVE